jgi:divalent metal cation (Fe/Co/Zn/Cd) transporter
MEASETHRPIDWHRRALWLAGATIAWNLIEGLVAMGFGYAEESVALFGFGVDSWVEVGSAGVVYWKLTRASGCATTRRANERRATRRISGLFLALAAATAFGAVAQLVAGRHPDSSVPSLVVSAVSLAFMGFLWQAKKATATALDSRTLAMDAACSLACIQLSGVLFAGSLLFLAVPSLWWADAAAALALSGLIAREGWEGWKATGKADFAGGCGCGG